MTANVNPIPVAIDYTSRDYYSLREDLIARVKARVPNWTGTDEADFGVAFVEAMAYMGDIMSYYIDRVANEGNILTATQRQSILELAASYGYTPSGFVSATCDLTFTNSSTSPITIPANTQFSVEIQYRDIVQDIVFALNSQTVVPASGSIVATARHAELVHARSENAADELVVNDIAGELVGVSTGLPGQEFVLSENQVVDGSVKVFIRNGNEYDQWDQVIHLTDFGPTDSVYSLRFDANNYVYVMFGDGVSGSIPGAGSYIKVQYEAGGGTAGNISDNFLFYFFQDAPGVTSTIDWTDLTIQNAVATGGIDPETDENIRALAPLALSAMNRVVTLEDFENYALSLPLVGKADATAASRSSVTLYVAPYRDDRSTDLYPGYNTTNTVVGQELLNIITSVKDNLSDKLQIGTSLTVSPPTYVPVSLEIGYIKRPQFTHEQVLEKLKLSLLSVFGYNYMTFGDTLRPEEVEFELRKVDGVLSVKVISLYRSSLTASRNTLIGASGEIFVFNEDDLIVHPDPALSAITLPTPYVVSPVFESTTFEYTVEAATGNLDVTLGLFDSASTVTVNGTSQSVVSGEVDFTATVPGSSEIEVTSADGTTSTVYTITFSAE
jgi:hypothetical protein